MGPIRAPDARGLEQARHARGVDAELAVDVGGYVPGWCDETWLDDDSPLPPEVRQLLLTVPEREHDIFRALKPYWIARQLAELRGNPGEEGSVEAFYLVKRIRSYFEEKRHAKLLPVPRKEEFKAAFGEDALLVESLWPMVSFLNYTENALVSDEEPNNGTLSSTSVSVSASAWRSLRS